MNLYKMYEMDPRAEQDGRWFKLRRSGFEVKLARTGNVRYQLMMASETAAAGISADKMTEEQAGTILDKVIAHTIVLDWKEAQGRDDQPLACTPEHVLQLLTDLPEFRMDVIMECRRFENFRLEADENSRKNSSTPSTGTSSGGRTNVPGSSKP